MSIPIRPIRPTEISKEGVIPEFVIEVVNTMLNEKSTGKGEITLMQDEIKKRVQAATTLDFDFDWLNFETLYEAYGWRVYYDKPGYGDTFDAFFKFTPKGR